ncbi:MAG: hypothetical protein ACJ8AJ_07575 [Gemmatimonadaceae bacterium]
MRRVVASSASRSGNSKAIGLCVLALTVDFLADFLGDFLTDFVRDFFADLLDFMAGSGKREAGSGKREAGSGKRDRLLLIVP